MSLAHAWVAALAPLAVAWAVWEWRHASRKTPAALKILSIWCVWLALAGPQLRVHTGRMAVAVLVDTSESLADADLARASRLANEIEAARGRHWVRVIPFARGPLSAEAGEYGKGGWTLRRAAGEAGQATDLEGALGAALAAMPAGLVPRVALITDGHENRGSSARAAALYQQLGTPIDAFALAGRARPELTIESAAMPAVAYAGEKFAIDLVVRSPRQAAGTIEISADGKVLGSSPVQIEAGVHALRAYASVSQPGVTGIVGAIRVPGSEDARFSRALDLRRPKLLYISQDPVGTERHLLDALRAAQFEIDSSQDALKPKLDGYQVVILNNQDIESLADARKGEIAAYVRQGGGLLVIGGENNVHPERTATTEDALSRALPATIAPPRAPEASCVVLVIDKSESMMQGHKIEVARLGAIGIIESLKPTDLLGVIIFDNAFRWLFPIGKVQDKEQLERLISGIEPSGGTQIPPALAEAYHQIAPVQAQYKHIVLLTDGVSEEGDSYGTARKAAAGNISISTIGLGRYINQPFLENLAAYSNGKSYFLEDPSGLQEVLLRDVQEHTQSTAVEKDLQPVTLKKVEMLEGVGMETAPPLGGYIRFTAKPEAETILGIDGKEPLLTRWRYGLGLAAVFTSDAKSRWASRWVSWQGFDKFWSNVVRDLLPRAREGEAKVDYDSASGELVVDYRLGASVEDPAVAPEIFALGPEGFRQPVEMSRAAERWYRGRLPIGDLQGLFRVRPAAPTRAFPEAGLYLATDELREYGNDEALLRQLAQATGGWFNPEPRQVFDAGGRTALSTLELWPGLLGLALLLNLAELGARKWRGVLETLRRK